LIDQPALRTLVAHVLALTSGCVECLVRVRVCVSVSVSVHVSPLPPRVPESLHVDAE